MRAIPKKNEKNVALSGKLDIDLTRKVISKKQLRQESQIETIELVRQERRYELITPLFGGGVEAGQNDPLTLISGKGLRGHLRFWWRATRGGQFGKDGIKQMHTREAEIWGAASTVAKPSPSQVQISVEVAENEQGKPAQPFIVEQKIDRDTKRPKFKPDGRTPDLQAVGQNDVAPPYAAFPLQPEAKEMVTAGQKTGTVQKGIFFTLRLIYPKDLEPEVDSALWAWDLFGGVGARTRRGFGALRLLKKSVNKVPASIEILGDSRKDALSKIKTQLKKYVVSGSWPIQTPHLAPNSIFELTDLRASALIAWRHLIAELKEFRQQRNPGKGNRPGRSKWPEPEQIRDLTGQRKILPSEPAKPKKLKHGPDPDLLSVKKFPRAAFGLPIIFQFSPSDYNKQNPYDADSDPRKTMLRLREYDRLASPLILRPVAVSANQFVGLALILEGTGEPNTLDLTLQNSEKNDESVLANGLKADLTKPEADLIKMSDSADSLLTDEDVLYSFLDFMEP